MAVIRHTTAVARLAFIAFLTAFLLVNGTETASAGRPKVGLVLSGGGAKGAAEVGVLKVIERAGIPIDYIAGTSIGSIVGGLYATGYDANELDSIFRKQEWLSLLTDRRDEYSSVPYKDDGERVYVFGFPVVEKSGRPLGTPGLLTGRQVEAMLDSLMGYRGYNEMENLPIPFRCVAFDMKTASEVVFSAGSPAQAMRASMSIPGCFKPVKYRDMTLVDGGMINNLPVDVVKEMGADIVIAIDLQQKKHKPRKSSENGILQQIAEAFPLGTMVNWAIHRPDWARYEENRGQCDLYINPNIPDDDTMSFKQESVERMLSIGEEEGNRYWEELVALKQRLDSY
ncbi:MAG: patatin-like phospholipase family protein [Prevotella sp.]|nr:patatin-like phospholipase family protein [Prevotella sp.]